MPSGGSRGDAAGALATLRETAPALAEAFGPDSREARRAQGLLLRALAAAGRCEEALDSRKAWGSAQPLPGCEG